jgi:hypothetical protein
MQFSYTKRIFSFAAVCLQNTVQALARDEMLGAAEPAQWEDAAASQGIRIRRHRRPTASMREIEEEMGAPRNILEKIIWDKEIEVAEVCFYCSLMLIFGLGLT